MPFVSIRIVKEALGDDAPRKKAAIARQVTAAITAATGLPNEAVSVVFEDVDARDWYVGVTDVETIRARQT